MIKLGKQIIYNADCLTLLKEIKNIDVIVTSPPYNIGVKYATYIIISRKPTNLFVG